MKVYISYSLNDTEQYVLSVLAKKLKEQGDIVSTSYDAFFSLDAYYTNPQLTSANLYIGLITASGNANDRVLQEWSQALSRGIPSILLVENGVAFSPSSFLHDPNVIIFNRFNPEPSIEMIRNKINASRQSQVGTTSSTNAWLMGGLAVLALIGLLSSEDK